MIPSANGLLHGKVALITGAGRGIGRAAALGFAREGAAVACVARTIEEVLETVRMAQAANGLAIACVGDVTDFAAMQAHCRMAESTFGAIDLVVGAAGASNENKPVADSDVDAWRQTIDVNLFGAFCTAKAALPALRRRQGGKIILVGSGMGHRGAPGRSAYAASKAGLAMLVQVLAEELVADGIAVNELVPGPVLTTFIAGREEQLRRATGGNEWFKTPEEVLPTLLFMATQPATGPTGQTFSLARRTL
jgi:3-oxoacyl-[acyl-carrier protein] reductase